MGERMNINREIVYRYLGYGNDEPDKKVKVIIEETEKELLAVIEPKYVYRYFKITNTADGIKVGNSELILQGRSIENHLVDCNEAVLLAATLSSGADAFIRKCEVSDMAKALIADTLASVAIESVCDEVELNVKKENPQLFQTFRFSPGYGDLSIDIQKDFLNLLDATKRTGLCATENYILTPRKSVTAIIGLSGKQIQKKRRSCRTCNMRDNCRFRKGGNHCGVE